MSTTAHGYHCTPTSTPTTFKETARSETSLAEPPTSGGGVVGSVANPPFGGVAPFTIVLSFSPVFWHYIVLSFSPVFWHYGTTYVETATQDKCTTNKYTTPRFFQDKCTTNKYTTPRFFQRKRAIQGGT